MGTCVKVISWNVRGLNCPNKRGDVTWVLHRFACDIAILQESKMEVVGQQVVVSLGSAPCSVAIFTFSGAFGRYYHYLGPSDFGAFVCCKFKSLPDNFV